MNGPTGVFTVPKSGIYHLDFVGLKNGAFDQLVIHLRVNGVSVASSFTMFGPVVIPVVIHSTLKLKNGDRVQQRSRKWDQVSHPFFRPTFWKFPLYKTP